MDTHANWLSDSFIRVNEVASYLGLSRSQVYRLIERGVLPAVRIGSAHRVPRAALHELLARQLEHYTKETL